MQIIKPTAPSSISHRAFHAEVDMLCKQTLGSSYSELVVVGELEDFGPLIDFHASNASAEAFVERTRGTFCLKTVEELGDARSAREYNLRQAASVSFCHSSANEEDWKLADDGCLYRLNDGSVQRIEVAAHKGVWGWLVSEAPATGSKLATKENGLVKAPQDEDFKKVAWTLDLEDSLRVEQRLSYSGPTMGGF